MPESNRQTEWTNNFEQVKTFSAANSRWPSTTAKDEAEKVLGQWWSRQKYLLNKKLAGEKAPGISAEREALLKGLIDSNTTFERDGVWEARYQTIAKKYEADSKLWPYATENVDEQKNIRWWNQQKTFARKFKTEPTKAYGGMTQERYDKIVTLMESMGQELDESVNAPAQSDNEASA